MAALPHITQIVYREFLQHFGQPDVVVTYDAAQTEGVEAPPLEQILVMVWRPTPELDITTFGTVGMSARNVPGATYRLELLFSARGLLDDLLERQVTQFLANMAGYPWDHTHTLDWGHTLSDPGPIPAFPGCRAILFHPRWVPEGWDTVEHGKDVVRLLNAVPLTLREKEIALRGTDLNAYWEEHEVDIFSDRVV
jgi:hypothetical protein